MSGVPISKLERLVWFAVAVILAGVWIFFEMIAGYEIPGRAHPILGTLVATALVFGGIDVAKVRHARRLLAGDLAHDRGLPVDERLAVLRREDPELVAALRRPKD